MRSISMVLLVLVFLPISSYSKEKTKAIEAIRVENKSIIVDGQLIEKQWQPSSWATDFVQFEPNKGEPAVFYTEIKILLDDDFIYVGISCHDPQARKLIARITKRDGLVISDDAIAVSLDTFSDGRSAYGFFTNILGTQLDGRFSDNGRVWDDTWDGEWKSAGARTEQGWTAEIAIRLSCLKFIPGQNMTWGLGVVRFIPRNLAIDTWTGPLENYGQVSQFGQLTGLDLQKTKQVVQFIPHLIAIKKPDQETQLEGGLDARFALSQSVSANLTINPDFAIIEADEEVVNLTRYEIFLPEKRNFFLEGSEVYNQRIQLFYSRRIADIYAGLKIHGKAGKQEFSSMLVQSKPSSDPDQESATFGVLRLRRDIFKSSSIGFLLANKLVGRQSTGSAGLDLVHFFSKTVNVTGQLALSYGKENSQNWAFFLRPSYDSSTFHLHLRYTHLGNNFADNANAVGFIVDDDRHELDTNLTKIWWPKKYGFEKIAYRSNYNAFWSTAGTLRSWEIFQETQFDFSNKFSLRIDYINEFRLDDKKYYNHQTFFEVGYNTREWQSIIANASFGKNFDAEFYLVGGGLNYKLFESLSLEYRLNRLVFNPDPEKRTKWIHVARLTNYFTQDLYLKFFFQTNSAIDKRNIQLVFVYRYQPPFGTIQLAYHKGTAAIGEESSQGHTLFLKISTVF